VSAGDRLEGVATPLQTSEARPLDATDAGQALVREYYTYMRRVVWHVLGPTEDLEDVIQDAVVAVMRSANSITKANATQGWVRAVTVNTARKYIRGRSRWYSRRTTFDETVLETHVPDPEARRVVRALYQALQRLPVDLRLVWTLRFVNRCTVGEIASSLEVSHATAKRRIVKARQRLEALARTSPALAHAFAQAGGGT